MPLNVAILISAYNHKQKVISCLDNCMQQIDSMASEGKYSFSIRLLDDSSTDWTIDEVKDKYPGVIAARSSQRLYRNASLRKLWTEAAKDNQDFYIWIDARISLKDNALQSLLENSGFLSNKAIIAGSVSNEEGELVRGGRTKKGKLCSPDPVIPIPTETFDGNLVLVPAFAYNILGMTSEKRNEYLGDWEYGLKALRNDVPRVIAPGVLATCDEISDVKIPLGARFLYDLKSSGVIFAVRNFFQLAFKALKNTKQDV